MQRLTELDARCRTIRAHCSSAAPLPCPGSSSRSGVGEACVTIIRTTAAIADALAITILPNAPATFELVAIARITRSGRAVRLLHHNGAMPQQPVDQALLRLILRARCWWALLWQGEISVTELAGRKGVTPSYLS